MKTEHVGIIQELNKEVDDLQDEVRRLKDCIKCIHGLAFEAGDFATYDIVDVCEEALK